MITTHGQKFRALIGGALKNVKPLNENAESGDEFAFGGGPDAGADPGAPPVEGGEDDGEYGSIEEITTALEDLVRALKAEVFGDEEGDDILDDSAADDDLGNVKMEARDKGTVLGTPLKGLKKGETLRSKINRVKGKLNKQGKKATTTLVTPETSVKSQPSSTFGGKPGCQKVAGQKSTKEDLF